MSTVLQTILMLLLSTTFVLPVHATDSAREQRWASQISDFLTEGEPLSLQADGKKFLAIYMPAVNKQPVGAVILLHGRGLHPDWPQVIQPLRTQLPTKGWASLSLQMPVLQSNATDEDYLPLFKDVPARIQAGLDFLSKQGLHNVVLIGHSLGANMATDYLSRNHDPRIKAFVGIDMTGKRQPAKYLPLDNVTGLLQTRIPVLDIYGSQTYPAVIDSADRRAFALAVHQDGSYRSRQIMVNGANHFFQGHEHEFLQSIANWMTDLIKLLMQENKLVTTAN